MAKRAALTAYGPMVVVAVEQSLPAELRVVTDELAARFLPFPVPALLKLGGREYAARYLEPLGRTMPLTEIERMVSAEKS